MPSKVGPAPKLAVPVPRVVAVTASETFSVVSVELLVVPEDPDGPDPLPELEPLEEVLPLPWPLHL